MPDDARSKIIVALDVDNFDAAKKLSTELSPHVGALKIGLELMTAVGAPQAVNALNAAKNRIFLDGKFKDIPNTVFGAARAASRLGVWMFNVHAMGGRPMMEKAMEAAVSVSKASNVKRPLVIAVTILTSMDARQLQGIGLDINSKEALQQEVVRLALLAKASGLDGVVASPQEVKFIREACGKDFLIVTPGVRPAWAVAGDQKRITTPHDAIKMGADYLVIGRPITEPPASVGSPAEAAAKIAEEIERAM